jgi:hypothetical protein
VLSHIAKNRYMRGSIAGITAGIAMNIASYLFVGVLNIGEDLATDYMAEMLFGRTGVILFEEIVAVIAHIMFTGFLGVLFAFLLMWVGSSFIYYKGLTFSWSTWFLLYAFGILFEVPLLKTNTASTVAIHFITATVYGAVWAYVLTYLDIKARV